MQIPYSARAFNPAHPDLAMGAGVPARTSVKNHPLIHPGTPDPYVAGRAK